MRTGTMGNGHQARRLKPNELRKHGGRWYPISHQIKAVKREREVVNAELCVCKDQMDVNLCMSQKEAYSYLHNELVEKGGSIIDVFSRIIKVKQGIDVYLDEALIHGSVCFEDIMYSHIEIHSYLKVSLTTNCNGRLLININEDMYYSIEINSDDFADCILPINVFDEKNEIELRFSIIVNEMVYLKSELEYRSDCELFLEQEKNDFYEINEVGDTEGEYKWITESGIGVGIH